MNEFLPPEDASLSGAREILQSALALDGGQPISSERTFYDTFDGLLYAGGLELVHEDGHLTLSEIDSGRQRAAAAAPDWGQAARIDALPEGTLRDALRTICGVRALLPIAHVQSRVRPFKVLDDQRKTVVRLTLEEPVAVANGHGTTPLRPRVRLAGVRGYDAELAAVQRRLEGELGFRAVDQPLASEAVRAAGGTPGGVSSKVRLPLGYNTRADEAASRVLRRLLEVITANLDGAVEDIDSEFLHDFRVSIRRTRAVQRELKKVFPAEQLERFRGEFRWLQRATGEARDLDVYVLEFDTYRALVPEAMRSDLDPVVGVLRARRDRAHAGMVSVLRSQRTLRLFSEWNAFLEQLVSLPVEERPDAAQAIGLLAGERIRKVYRQMTKMGRPLTESSPATDFHELRKKAKELRYLLELFGLPVYPTEVVRPMIKTLKSLQDVLGHHQDREVQITTLHALSEEVASQPGGAAALMAMGVLLDRFAADAREARGAFAERFAAFASKSQRRLVKATFA